MFFQADFRSFLFQVQQDLQNKSCCGGLENVRETNILYFRYCTIVYILYEQTGNTIVRRKKKDFVKKYLFQNK